MTFNLIKSNINLRAYWTYEILKYKIVPTKIGEMWPSKSTLVSLFLRSQIFVIMGKSQRLVTVKFLENILTKYSWKYSVGQSKNRNPWLVHGVLFHENKSVKQRMKAPRQNSHVVWNQLRDGELQPISWIFWSKTAKFKPHDKIRF